MRQAEMTPANVHDSRLGEALIQGDEQVQGEANKATSPTGLMTARLCARRSNGAAWSIGIAWKVKHARYPLGALAKAQQRLGGEACAQPSSAPSPR